MWKTTRRRQSQIQSHYRELLTLNQLGAPPTRRRGESKVSQWAVSIAAISETKVLALLTTLSKGNLKQSRGKRGQKLIRHSNEKITWRSRKGASQVQARNRVPQVLILSLPIVKSFKTYKSSMKMMTLKMLRTLKMLMVLTKTTLVKSMFDSISQDRDHSLKRELRLRDTHQLWRTKVLQCGQWLEGKLKRESLLLKTGKCRNKILMMGHQLIAWEESFTVLLIKQSIE